MTEVQWGPSGQTVYERTYSRPLPNGEKETWPQTAERVARGNLSLVYGPPEQWDAEVSREYRRLVEFITAFKVIPGGRHLWASGVKGRQYLFNCHVSGWGEKFSDHYEFTFLRLMEGGGVGANYSSKYLRQFGVPRRELNVHIVCDPSHQDYEEMKAAGLLSEQFSHEWEGAFPVEDSREGWAAALVDLIDTYMTDDEVRHADRVYDVTRVRPKGAPLRTFGGTASGPLPFATMLHEVGAVMNEASMFEPDCHITPIQAMEIDHAIAQCVVSGGVRRSARMSIVRWDDPYIFDFIGCKADGARHWTTNISVEIDDEFTVALVDERDSQHDHAMRVHNAVVQGMLTNGEPGYWNSDVSNVGEPNRVIATNPCGEIALEEWENCNLGHVNLDAFAPKRKGGPVDTLGIMEAHRLITRFLIRATYGDVRDSKQAEKLARNRRIGVGHLGVQAYWAKQGIPFSLVPKLDSSARNLRWMYGLVREEARKYAFDLRIPEPVKVTTVAPTGTIAKLPGTTEGIHPIYSRFYERRIRFSLVDPDQARTVNEAREAGYKVETDVYDKTGNTAVVVYPTKDILVEQVEALGIPAEVVESADEISLADMLAFQAMYQEAWADNAVSFTVNVRPGLDPDTVASTLTEWLPWLKGTTLMVDESREQAPYTRITREQYEAAEAKRVEDSTDEECSTGACPVR